MKPIAQKLNTPLLLLLVITSLNLIIFSCGKSNVKPKPTDTTKKPIDTTKKDTGGVKPTGGPDIYVAGYETSIPISTRISRWPKYGRMV